MQLNGSLSNCLILSNLNCRSSGFSGIDGIE